MFKFKKLSRFHQMTFKYSQSITEHCILTVFSYYPFSASSAPFTLLNVKRVLIIGEGCLGS